MADYYSILKKTIAGLPKNTAEARKLVYGKARSAIDRQLRSIQPAPSEAAIEAQMTALEDAIDAIEAEYSPDAQEEEQSFPSPPYSPPPAERNHESAAGRIAPRTARPSVLARPQETRERSAGPDRTRPSRRLPVQDDGERRPSRPQRRRGLAGRLAMAVVLIALLAGGGYVFWQYRTPIMALLGIDQDEAVIAGNTQDGEADDPDSAAVKEEARLGENGETVEPEPLQAAEEAEPMDQVEESDFIGIAGADPDEVEVSPVDEESSPAPPTEEAALPVVGQKAFLYEEGVGDAPASRDNAAIVWTLEKQAPADGLPPEAVIKGEFEVPGRGLSLDILIKRNTDSALSASHIIELTFDTPPDFSGGDIETLARFVMKSSEQARGEPLVAVPVKISSGYFMIALNNLEQARQSNKRLMLELNWIDIPLAYSTGRRALLALEKGGPGTQVFEAAFADWDNR